MFKASCLPNHRLIYILLFSLGITRGREADDRSRFLYADDPGATAILEYQLHNAPSEDYSGDERERASKEQPGSEYDEERHIKPFFLRPDNGPRVVQYYSPWCGLPLAMERHDMHRHCQTFKRKYIALAEEVNRRLPDDQPEINFHAISCSVYHWVCMQSNVKTFPAIFAFKANSGERQLLKEEYITADSIAEALEVQLDAPLIVENNSILEREGNDEFRPVDILGASLYSLTRTRDAVYNDAALSFMHALKTEVFSVKEGMQALNPVQREVFTNWIDLLYWTLPPTWMLHTLINDIRNNIDSVMSSEGNLLFMVEKHRDVVNGGNMKWSVQCSKSDDRAGYSCGLWSLFHIVSIGVIERHRAVLGARDQVSTKFVARTVRNYVEQFFDCEVCKEYFLEMFDRCGFNHCRRFKQPQKLPPPESWAEFAMWLWEVHNDVNVKLVEAGSQREGGNVGISKRKSTLSDWPTVNQCPSCRDDNGHWKKDAILRQLKKEYWPAGVQNFRFIVLKKKDTSKGETSGFLSVFSESVFFLFLAAVVFMWSKKQFIHFTGRHKKMDHDYV